MWVRVRWLFYLAVAALALDIGIQIFHVVEWGRAPKWVWIGLVSLICLFIGFLSERRFKQFAQESVDGIKKQVGDFFYGWS
jgi:VanZ family protein